MPSPTLTKIKYPRFRLFIICLSVALTLWVFYTLSDRYTYSIHAKIQGPPGTVFQPGIIQLKIESTGWQLLFSELTYQTPSVYIDSKITPRRNRILLNKQLKQIQKQIGYRYQLLAVYPDTIYGYTSPGFKTVPVLLSSKIECKKQYGISNPITITPKYVRITGNKEVLNQVKAIKTNHLYLTTINHTIDSMLALAPPSDGNIAVFPSKVKVTVPVNQFTERKISIPVKIFNQNGYKVNIIPQYVQVTFLVALNNYKENDEDTLEASVDLNNWKNKHYTQLPVTITRSPKFCKIIRVEPQIIDFIIEE